MVPLHPAMVHLPLGLALVAPLLALGFTVAFWRGWLPKRAFWTVVGVQALLVGGAFVALQSGEAEEDAVERLVSHAAIESHEEAAKLFFWAAIVALVISAAAALLKSEKLAKPLALVSTVAAFVVAGLGFGVGKAGGELVYVHGAAASYAKVPAEKDAVPAVYGEDDHDRGDRDDDRHRD